MYCTGICTLFSVTSTSSLLLNLLPLWGERSFLTKRNTIVSIAMDWQFPAMVALSLPSALSVLSPGNPDGILSFKTRSVSFASASQSLCLVTNEVLVLVLGQQAMCTMQEKEVSRHLPTLQKKMVLSNQQKILMPLNTYKHIKSNNLYCVCSDTTKALWFLWLVSVRTLSCILPESVWLLLLGARGFTTW